MNDAMTTLLFVFALELALGAPLPRLVSRLETWPISYVPSAKA
jgi:hypothetical protein